MKSEIKRGDIFLVDLDPAIGSEIKKTRPVLVISNDINNKSLETITILPITSSVRTYYPFETFISAKDSGLSRDSRVKCNQIRTVNKKRFVKFIGKVDDEKLREVEGALLVHLGVAIYE